MGRERGSGSNLGIDTRICRVSGVVGFVFGLGQGCGEGVQRLN